VPDVSVPKPLLVALGGVVGAALRWATGEGLDDALATLVVVNGLGSFLLGALLARPGWRDLESLRLWLGTGFCGGLTTFSTLAAEVALRLDDGRAADAVGFAAVTFGVGLVAAVVGHVSVARWGHP
jgi:CrcB protein